MAGKSRGVWWWEKRQQFYATVKGKQVPLGADKDEAERQWHILMAKKNLATEEGDNKLFCVVAEAFLEWVERNRKANTYISYAKNLQSFDKVHPDIKVAALRPHHIDAVLAVHPSWSKSTIRGFMVSVLACLGWAMKKGYITTHPLKGRLELPTVVSRGRDACMQADDYEILIQHANGRLKDFLVAARNTGTRPHIISEVSAADFDEANEVWILKNHKTNHDGKPLVVHLNETMVALTRRLAALHPTGCLFLNTRGVAWTEDSWGKAMRYLKKALAKKGIKLKGRGIMYGARHEFATALLEAGTADSTVAALLNHKNTNMLHAHYSHLTGKNKLLKSALAAIKPTCGETVGDAEEKPLA